MHSDQTLFMHERLILRLYPGPSSAVGLHGLYLKEQNHLKGSGEMPFVYANFLTSLDGRIAVENSAGQMMLPPSLTNPNDFRLFLELHAQADCLITHGAYLRALDRGDLGNILQVGHHPLGADLQGWRKAQNLLPQPAVVVTSRNLDFPDPRPWLAPGQECFIVAGSNCRPESMRIWRERGYEVVCSEHEGELDGGGLVDLLAARNFRSIYLIAGPKMLELMVRSRRLGMMYQTLSHQLLGGEGFRTLIEGPVLGDNGRLQLRALHQDSESGDRPSQWFAKFALNYG